MSSLKKMIMMGQSAKKNSVYWNQLNENNPASSDGGVKFHVEDGILHMNGTSTGTYFGLNGSYSNMMEDLTLGKYLVNCQVLRNPDNLSIYPRSLNSKMVEASASVRSLERTAYITKVTEDTIIKYNGFGFSSIPKNTEINDVQLRISFHDLTLMFGAGNEPATVEEFDERIEGIPVDIYAYNPGETIEW